MRAKFKTDFITDYGVFQKVEMSAVYSQNRAKEDNQFSDATPSGKLDMTITTKGAYGFLKPGINITLTLLNAKIKVKDGRQNVNTFRAIFRDGLFFVPSPHVQIRNRHNPSHFNRVLLYAGLCEVAGE